MSDTPESLLTPELLSWIGHTTERRSLGVLSASDIRRYVDATGDANPLWLDAAYARAAGYRGRLIPPTLVGWVPFSLKEGGQDPEGYDVRRSLPLPSHYTNVRNAGTELEWLQPVYFGEELFVQTQVVAIVARQGRAGLGVYVTQEGQVLNPANEIVSRRRSTIVLLPAGRLAADTGATG
jgi:acyl dehydratase